MNENDDPALQGRRLRRRLHQLRIELSLSQKDVAQELDWSPSKVLRIESGAVRVSTTDLRALLGLYRVVERPQIDQLVKMAQVARRQTWQDYRDVLSPEFIRYCGYEGAAAFIRNFESQYVPGLLQTADYAAEIMRQRIPDEPNIISRRVESRMERQKLVSREGGPKLFFMLDECVIRRWVGGPTVMRRQLRHLKLVEKNPAVTMQIVTFESGICVGIAGSFAHLQFPDANDGDMLYIENAQGDMFLRDDEEAPSAFLSTFMDLEGVASAPEAFQNIIDDAIDAIPER